jgi:hypothetical protein
MSRYRSYSKTRLEDEDEDGHMSIKDKAAMENRRKEKRLKNVLKSKKFDALLEEDDEYDI